MSTPNSIFVDTTDAPSISIEETVNTLIVSPTGLRGPRGPQGVQGPPADGTAGNFVHTQNNPTTVVLVQHNLNYRPAGIRAFSTQINALPTDQDEVEGVVTYINSNSLTVRFDEPFAGIIYIS